VCHTPTDDSSKLSYSHAESDEDSILPPPCPSLYSANNLPPLSSASLVRAGSSNSPFRASALAKEGAQERQQKHQHKIYDAEITKGERSPGGTKRKVSKTFDYITHEINTIILAGTCRTQRQAQKMPEAQYHRACLPRTCTEGTCPSEEKIQWMHVKAQGLQCSIP
jgi:hypothetical protein